MVYGNSFKWMEVVNKFGNLWMDHVGLSCNGIPMIHGPTPLPMIVRAGPSSSEGAVQSPEEGAVPSTKAVPAAVCANASVASTLTRSTGVSSPQSSVLCSPTPPLQSRNLEALATPPESDMLHEDGTSAVIETMPQPEPCPNLLAAMLVVEEQDPKTSSETVITVQGTLSKSEMVNEENRSAVQPPEPCPNLLAATLVVQEQKEDPKTSSETVITLQGTIASGSPAKVKVKKKKKEAPSKAKAKKVVVRADDVILRVEVDVAVLCCIRVAKVELCLCRKGHMITWQGRGG